MIHGIRTDPTCLARISAEGGYDDQHEIMTKLLIVLSVLAFVGGLGAIVTPLGQVAQPLEKSGEPSSGVRLAYREASRRTSPAGDFITYVLRADGLPKGKAYSLTGTWMNGKTAKVPEPLHTDGSGRVLAKDGSEFNLILGGTFAGEFIGFTLLSDDGTAKASVEITPVPIEAVGKGGCRLSARPMSIRGDSFSISGEGFGPDQQIKGVASSSGELANVSLKNRGDGSFKLVVFPGVVGKGGGEADLTASDSLCSVTLHYNWGDAMMKDRRNRPQAAPEAQATPTAPAAPTRPQTAAQPAPNPTP
jgi:hypothetical protein